MTISEHSRHELYTRLEGVLGTEAASTLMEHLPPVGWADVATKRDLDALGAVLRSEMATFRAEVRADAEALRADLRGEINSAITSQTRTMMFSVIGSNVTIAAVAFAAASLR